MPLLVLRLLIAVTFLPLPLLPAADALLPRLSALPVMLIARCRLLPLHADAALQCRWWCRYALAWVPAFVVAACLRYHACLISAAHTPLPTLDCCYWLPHLAAR